MLPSMVDQGDVRRIARSLRETVEADDRVAFARCSPTRGAPSRRRPSSTSSTNHECSVNLA
jgi:hypothetical protein